MESSAEEARRCHRSSSIVIEFDIIENFVLLPAVCIPYKLDITRPIIQGRSEAIVCLRGEALRLSRCEAEP